MLFDPSNSEAFWLDITNAGLGVICLVCVLAIGWGVTRDLADRWRRVPSRRSEDLHAFDDALLGMTMADGGKVKLRKAERTRASRN